jgi:hypothetical protein
MIDFESSPTGSNIMQLPFEVQQDGNSAANNNCDFPVSDDERMLLTPNIANAATSAATPDSAFSPLSSAN